MSDIAILDDRSCACGSGLFSSQCCQWDSAHARAARPTGSLEPLQDALQTARRAGDRGAAGRLSLELIDLAPTNVTALGALAEIRLAEGNIKAGGALLRRVQAVDPNNLTATCELAQLSLQRGDLNEAERHARHAVRLGPLYARSHALMGLVLTEANRPKPGEWHYRRALELMGHREPVLLTNLAWNLKTQGRIEESRALYAESIAAMPDDPRPLIGCARMEEAAGNLDSASALLDRADVLGSPDLTSRLTRAVLASRRGDNDRALEILNAVEAQSSGRAPPIVLMEKGRLLDRMRRPPEAFAAWTEGKRRLRANSGASYGQAEAAAFADRVRRFFTAQRRSLLPSAPVIKNQPQPIFILGFPRSGTTLVEQILSAHPFIEAGDELPLIYDLIEMAPRVLASPNSYPEALAELWMGDRLDGLETLRDHYLRRASTMVPLQAGTKWFTDKMPLNEMHLGLISMVFPQSPLIHVLRHPLDVVLSAFGNELTHGYRCAYDLESTARHYVLVAGVVEHLRAELALHYTEVRYEDLVADYEQTVRRLLRFIGVPYRASCLAFHENRRYARTASYAQVTEPLYQRSVGRYRAYLDQLAPVIPLLEPTIKRLGYTI